MRNLIVFEKQYDGESIVDVERHIYEALSDDYNEIMKAVPRDQYNIPQGTFKVTITWEES